jgi:hypothetical protein
MRQHFVGHAAEQQAGQPAIAVRSDKDDVAFALLGGLDDAAIGEARHGDQRLERHALRLGRGGDLVDTALRALARAALEFGRQRLVGDIALTVDVGRHRLLCAVAGDPRAHFLGHRDACLDCCCSDARSICRNQDVLEHGSSSIDTRFQIGRAAGRHIDAGQDRPARRA